MKLSLFDGLGKFCAESLLEQFLVFWGSLPILCKNVLSVIENNYFAFFLFHEEMSGTMELEHTMFSCNMFCRKRTGSSDDASSDDAVGLPEHFVKLAGDRTL